MGTSLRIVFLDNNQYIVDAKLVLVTTYFIENKYLSNRIKSIATIPSSVKGLSSDVPSALVPSESGTGNESMSRNT